MGDELLAGKCYLGLMKEELIRCVFVVAVRLRLGDGSKDFTFNNICADEGSAQPFLVKVGDVIRSTGEIKVSCALPGTTKAEKETDIVETLQRLIREDFSEICPFIRIDHEAGHDTATYVRDSPTY